MSLIPCSHAEQQLITRETCGCEVKRCRLLCSESTKLGGSSSSNCSSSGSGSDRWVARGLPRDGINFSAAFGLSRTVEAHLRVSKQSPGTLEVIRMLLVLQGSGASVAEEAERRADDHRGHAPTVPNGTPAPSSNHPELRATPVKLQNLLSDPPVDHFPPHTLLCITIIAVTYSKIHKHIRAAMTGKLLAEHERWIHLPSYFRFRVSSLPSLMSGYAHCESASSWLQPLHRRVQITSIQCQGERDEFDSFRWFFIGNWGTAGETAYAPPSHLRVSHDQTPLWIDTSLSNGSLLAVETRARTDGRTEGCK